MELHPETSTTTNLDECLPIEACLLLFTYEQNSIPILNPGAQISTFLQHSWGVRLHIETCDAELYC